jgi:H/ACA ribonucleoprotein complex non-core subunit NAF1
MDPAIPQDVSLIMEMVQSHQVVGSMPPLDMTVREKRRLVEESMRLAKEKKEKAKEAGLENPKPTIPAPLVDDDSSSEEESSSEGESEDEGKEKPPMTEEEHRILKAEADEMVYGPEAELDSDFEEADSDSDDEEVFKLGEGADLRQLAMEMMEEEEPAPSGPILSANEAPLPPVAQPPIVKLPEGERLNLAGDVVSWMRDKKAEAWVAKVAAEEAEATDAPVNIATPSVPTSPAVDRTLPAPAAPVDPLPLDEEDEVELVTSGVADEDDTDVEPTAQTTNETTTPVTAPEPTETPKFQSAGTVIIRAMQNLPSTGEDGWLEEGSVVCFSDGRVLGTVS